MCFVFRLFRPPWIIRIDPHPKFGSDVETDAHTKRLWKSEFIYILEVSGGGQDSHLPQARERAGKGDRLAWGFCGERVGMGRRFPGWVRVVWFEPAPKERAGFHSSLPRWRAEGGQGRDEA